MIPANPLRYLCIYIAMVNGFNTKGLSMTTPNTLQMCNDHMVRRKLLGISALAFLPAGLLSACGGGDSDPPTIALYATINGGVVGTAFSLSADADDDDGIEKVEFFRIRNGSEELLITFTAKPYLYATEIPTGTAGTTIEYRARVTDTDDQTTDSNKISINVSA